MNLTAPGIEWANFLRRRWPSVFGLPEPSFQQWDGDRNYPALNRLLALLEQDRPKLDMWAYGSCALGYTLNDVWFAQQGFGVVNGVPVYGDRQSQEAVMAFFGLTKEETVHAFGIDAGSVYPGESGTILQKITWEHVTINLDRLINHRPLVPMKELAQHPMMPC